MISSRDGNPIFLNWVGYHGRSDGLARQLDIPCLFIAGGEGNFLKRYFRQWRETRLVLKEHNPDTVILMQPPAVAFFCLLLARKTPRIWADFHTGAFSNPKWKWAIPLILKWLRKRGSAIVTGEELADLCRKKGVNTFVVHDVVEPPDSAGETNEASDDIEALLPGLRARKFGLAPLSYNRDEPTSAILTAASLNPDVCWVLTGRPPASVRNQAPSNVIFSGFVSNADYEQLLLAASFVVALTAEENTMQRAGYEALAYSKPLLTSPTRILRNYFENSCQYAGPNSSEIAAAAERLLTENKAYEAKMLALRTVRVQQHEESIRLLREKL